MFHTPDYYHNISMRLSEVLDDIGVNENMVMKWRRTFLLRETMHIITARAKGQQSTLIYRLGSRSEGTTTIGLKSDTDTLTCSEKVIVIQHRSEWTPGKYNHLMIQNETTPPGYCLLQALRTDAPLPLTHETQRIFVKDTSGRILVKNIVIDAVMIGGRQRQGPSMASAAKPGIYATDIVLAYPCKSWPQSSTVCLERQETNSWPTAEMKRYAKTTKCFVVGVGRKDSENADFEWRISTPLDERCLMFNINITQIRIYILMKMIFKTFINVENLNNGSYISSFMCKTVLFYCIASKPSKIWKECNILNCLSFCIQTMNRCILAGNCPHFFDHENNLMAGKISTDVKHQLLERMSNLIPCDETFLFGIQIDDLGERLQIKLNMINEVHHDILQPDEYTMNITATLLQGTVKFISSSHYGLIHRIKDESLEMKLKILLQAVLHFTRYYRDGNMLEKTACRFLAPLYCTSIGSLIASQNIQINNTVSPQTLAWLEAGMDSDVASSRLKLASIMYCTGDMERVAMILSHIEEQYSTEVTETVCVCYFYRSYLKTGFFQLCCQYDAAEFKYIFAFCVRFFPSEINCVPHELQYEMFRSTQEDLPHRGEYDYWMDCAVVDSLPYLYFLQYKTYSSLQRPEEQQEALTKLMWVIRTERNLAHGETALNLLGQCMEQENRPVDALQCYMISLRFRERNNAAKLHICMCLANTIS